MSCHFSLPLRQRHLSLHVRCSARITLHVATKWGICSAPLISPGQAKSTRGLKSLTPKVKCNSGNELEMNLILSTINLFREPGSRRPGACY
jgi:hypothetical protein